MNKHLKIAFVVAVVLAMVLSACGPKPTEAPAKPTATEAPAVEEKIKVAVAFPGVVSDQSWNEWGYEGLKAAEEECGVEIAYSEDVFQDEQLETFRNYAAEGYDIIIGHGGEYADAIQTVAAEYPDLWFGDTNGVPGGDNVSAIVIGYNQPSYLAGYLACEMTEANHIAFVGGEELPVLASAVEWYEKGAQACGKEVRIDVVYTGDWADVTKAREAGLALIADGADVLYHILDTADAGLIAAAEDKGKYAIGLYRDSSPLGPDAVIGSAICSPAGLVYHLSCGDVPKGEVALVDVHDERFPAGIHMTELTPPDVQEKVNEVFEKIKAGEMEIKNFGEE